MSEHTITAKMTINKTAKAVSSKEYKMILSTATASSIGLLLI